METVILSILKEHCTPVESQFRFEGGIAVAQALLQAKDNAQAGMNYLAVFDLQKMYDKVVRMLLLEVMRKWVEGETLNMTRAMLGPM